MFPRCNTNKIIPEQQQIYVYQYYFDEVDRFTTLDVGDCLMLVVAIQLG